MVKDKGQGAGEGGGGRRGRDRVEEASAVVKAISRGYIYTLYPVPGYQV